MPTDKTRADMAGKKQKSLLRSLLGLPESRQLNAEIQTSVPPVAFNYKETEEGRNFYADPHVFESEADITPANSANEENGQPYLSKVKLETQPPASSFVYEDASPNGLRPDAEQKEAQAAWHISNEGNSDKSSQAVRQSTETANSKSKASDSLGRMGEEPEKTEAAIDSSAAEGQMHTGTKTPAEQRNAAAATQNSVEIVSPISEMSGTPTTFAQVDTNSSIATEEIQVPGISPAKQLFPSLLEGAPVDLQAGSQGHQEKAMPVTSRQRKEESASLSETVQTNSLASSNDTQSQSLREKGKSSATMGLSVTVSGKNSILSRVARQENKQEIAAKKIAKASSTGMSQISPATAALPEEMLRQSLFTAQEASHADSEKVAQLRRSFHELMVKKLAGRQERNKQHTTPEEPSSREEEAIEQPAIQQVVVVQRNPVPRRSKQTAAFWERSYSGRSWLKMIR